MQSSASGHLVWNADPVFVRFGQLEIRYYGVLLALGIAGSFAVWYRRARAHGESKALAEAWLWWSVPSELLGARLGQILLYGWPAFASTPSSASRPGAGMNSHGVGLALLLTTWGFARRYNRTFLTIADYAVPGLALGVCCVRLGNFVNAEIVGRTTSVPWAVVFARFDSLPRHPVQLYEAAAAMLCVLAIWSMERQKVSRPGSGLSTGSFLLGYFTLRIGIEFLKQSGVEPLRASGGPLAWLERITGLPLNTAQWLSVIPATVGAVLVLRALRSRRRTVRPRAAHVVRTIR